MDKNYYEPALFEVGPVFYGKKPGQQKILLGALKSGTVSKKNWIEKERPIDVFDVKDDIIKSLLKLGLKEQDLFLSNKSEKYFHPGKSGSIRLGLANGPLLGYFGEIHPGIIRRLDLKNDNLAGFEIIKPLVEPVVIYVLPIAIDLASPKNTSSPKTLLK